MGRDVGVMDLLLEMGAKGDAHFDACTHECAAHYIDYDGALEAEPRLLKQTRKFLLSQPASTNQTFQACGVRPCDARGARRYLYGQAQNGPSHKICPIRSNFRRIGGADHRRR
jgi:hypothetical protein